MESKGVFIIVIIVLVTIILLGMSLTKTEKQKAWEKKQKQAKKEELSLRRAQEQKRIDLLRKEKEANKLKKLASDRERADQIIEKGKILVSDFGKLVSDGTSKIKTTINKTLNKHYLTSFSWLMVTSSDDHILFNFKDNNELFISKNGTIEKGSYELLTQNKSIIITRGGSSKHFNFINLNNDYYFLNKVSTTDIYAFINQTKVKDHKKEWFLNEIKLLKQNLR